MSTCRPLLQLTHVTESSGWWDKWAGGLTEEPAGQRAGLQLTLRSLSLSHFVLCTFFFFKLKSACFFCLFVLRMKWELLTVLFIINESIDVFKNFIGNSDVVNAVYKQSINSLKILKYCKIRQRKQHHDTFNQLGKWRTRLIDNFLSTDLINGVII